MRGDDLTECSLSTSLQLRMPILDGFEQCGRCHSQLGGNSLEIAKRRCALALEDIGQVAVVEVTLSRQVSEIDKASRQLDRLRGRFLIEAVLWATVSPLHVTHACHDSMVSERFRSVNAPYCNDYTCR